MRFLRLKWKSEKGVEAGACWKRNGRPSRKKPETLSWGRTRARVSELWSSLGTPKSQWRGLIYLHGGRKWLELGLVYERSLNWKICSALTTGDSKI